MSERVRKRKRNVVDRVVDYAKAGLILVLLGILLVQVVKELPGMLN